MVRDLIRKTVLSISKDIFSVVRISRKTLAITMVEECSKDETGVGLSMALGNQGWNRNCADLATIPIKSLTETTVSKTLN